MQTLDADYVNLNTKLGRLKEQRAVLVSKELDKERQRATLTEELVLLGIDVSNPAAEIARLEAEAAEELRQAREQVDQFERDLNAATLPQKQETTTPVTALPPQDPTPPEPAEVPSDLDIL